MRKLVHEKIFLEALNVICTKIRFRGNLKVKEVNPISKTICDNVIVFVKNFKWGQWKLPKSLYFYILVKKNKKIKILIED